MCDAAPPQFLTHGAPHRVCPVGHHGHGIGVTATAACDVVEPIIPGPEVAVTAGLADDATAVKQSWHRLEQTIPYRLRKTDISATHIPDGRESAIKARVQERRGMVRKIRHGRLSKARKVQPGQIDMDMSVNQAWHQHATTAIDDFCIRGYGIRDGNYVLDGCARDYNIVAFDEPVGFAVEDARSAKNDGFGFTHGGFSPIQWRGHLPRRLYLGNQQNTDGRSQVSR
jgi:hypothetical protein